MGLNYWIGKTFSTLRDEALVRGVPGIYSRYPRGRVFPLDLARLACHRPIEMVLDIGANHGQTALEMRRWFPGARVHSFEPVAENYRLLEKNVAGDSRISAHHAACGSAVGTQFIRYGNHDHLHSLAGCESLTGDQKEVAGETVNVTTVDEFCVREGITRIDLLKTDTEGYDMEVLRGAEGMLAKEAIRFVFVEAGLNRQPSQTPFCEVQARLLDRGFVFSGFYDPMRGGEHKEILWFCNALFTHRDAIAAR